MSTTVRYRKPRELATLGRRHAVVEASAGTGKTYLIEHLVVDLLLRAGVELPKILVVTFTEKATAELTVRVRSKLEELLHLGPDDPAARAAADAPDDEVWTLNAAARARLRTALTQFDRASIFTIHGFCQRVLRDTAFWQGRLFGEEIVEESEAFHGAFVDVLRHDVVGDDDKQALLEAWRRAGYDLARLERLLSDCAKKLGTGTSVEVRPERGFDLARFRQAAAAWPARGLGDDAAELCVRLKTGGMIAQTAGSLAGRLVSLTEILAGGERPIESIVALATHKDAKERGGLFPRIVSELTKYPGTLADATFAATLEAAQTLAAFTPSLHAALVHAFLPAVRARLERRKRAAGLFDFQDMLALVARSLAGDGPDDPRAAALVSTLRARYSHALVDEFQDTDELQWSIFRKLFVDTPGAVLTLVGDPKQAIYGFRGADVHTYLAARDELVGGPDGVVPLSANFRSTAPLIAAYNAILGDDGGLPFFRADGPIRYDRPVTCGRPHDTLLGRDGKPAPPVVVFDLVTEQPKLRLWELKPVLLERITREIRDLLGGSLELRRDGASKPLCAGDIFILTRTVRESREVGEALRAAALPFAFFKQEKLFDTVEAAAVLDVLRALVSPDDPTARARAFITPFFGLTLPELAACDDLAPEHPLAARLHAWRALADAGDFEALFARIVDDSGLVCREVFTGGSERALTNYLHLFELLQGEAARSRAGLRELTESLACWVAGTRRPAGTDSDVQRLETDADAVQIMTIHQSKGLEAPVVFLYGGVWPGPKGDVRAFHEARGRVVRVGLQPDTEQASYEREQQDEERRVYYVALTRARGRLYLPRYHKPFALKGEYQLVNERLHAITGGLMDPAVRAHFACERLACPQPPAPTANVLAPALATFTAPPELLAPAPADPAFTEAARTRAGFVVTSYSSMKRHTEQRARAFALVADDKLAGEAEGEPVAVADELPPGRLSGTFLHEIIEELPLETLADPAVTFDAWWARPEVTAVFDRARRRHDRDAAHLPHAARLVFGTLAAPTALGEVEIPALARAPRAVRELDFVYPLPERAHPIFAAPPADGDGPPYRIERGVVKGFVDYLFEHDGRIYVCDWKSDTLARWDDAHLGEHCARHYDVQARLYTLAALRLCGLEDPARFAERFGGVLFVFLRARRAGDPRSGVFFSRPSWDDVVGWQRALLTAEVGP